MTRTLIAATALLLGTAAFADQSDRYNDLRLDTSKNAERTFSDDVRQTDLDRAQRGRDRGFETANNTVTPNPRLSARNAVRTDGEGYIYGGFGPVNDSR